MDGFKVGFVEAEVAAFMGLNQARVQQINLLDFRKARRPDVWFVDG